MKHPLRAQEPGVLAEDANLTGAPGYITILLVNVVEFAFSTVATLEPKMPAEALKQPDANNPCLDCGLDS